MKPLLGAHTSISGGLEKALLRGRDLECPTIQIFTKNATTWRERTLDRDEISLFRATAHETEIVPVVAHNSYLVNLASPEDDLYEKSLSAMFQELVRCEQLGIGDLVIHPGAHRGQGIAGGIDRITDALNRLFRDTRGFCVRIILEMTAGQGTAIGCRTDHIAMIIERVHEQARVGICLDTCHIFAAGYDIGNADGWDAFLEEMNEMVGLERIRVMHLNDSLRECGSRVDRHADIGKGMIGEKLFRAIMTDRRFQSIPKIIETPKEKDHVNLNLLREYAKKS